jgi:hypothetical protein
VRALQNGAGVATSLLTCSKGIRFENRRRNLGAILVAFAREHPPLQSVTIDGVAFVDLTFGEAQFRSVRFDGCNFLGVDLEATVFADCEADNSTFHALKLSNESRLGIAGLEPGQNVGSVHHPSTGEVYAPQDVRKILERLGMPTPTPDAVPPSATYSAEAQVLIQLLQHVARAYRRTNVLYEADDHLKQVFQSPHWPRLKQLLINHGIVSEEIRGVSGPRAPRFRLRVALDDLLRGQTATDGMQGPVAELWQELRTV